MIACLPVLVPFEEPTMKHSRLRHAGPSLVLIALALAGSSLRAQTLDGYRDYVERAVADWEATGLAVAVVKDGELLLAEGFGVRRLGEPGPVDEHTRFAIGSTTKAMTAAAIGMLVDEGRLGWDDLVVEHLPWFRVDDPYVSRQMTIRDLLTHRAGMGNADFLWYERDVSREEVVRKMAMVEPAYSLRSSFIYQNIMYATAGEVVEAVSGMPWADFIRTRVFRPLGMDESVTHLEETVDQPNVASPHDRVDGRTVPIRNASVDAVDAAGSVWSSVSDMSRWLRMLLAEGLAPDGTRILSEATVEEMFRPQTLVPPGQFYPTQQITRPSWVTYGLAWFQHDYRGHKVDFHTGSIDGMVAIAGLVRDLDLGVYVLANRDHVEVRHAIMYRAFDHFLGGDERDWSGDLKALYDDLASAAERRRSVAEERRVPGTSPSLALDEYVGEYTHPLFGALSVSRNGDGLRADLGPGQPGTLDHWHYDTFRLVRDARWRGSTMVTFVLGVDGKVAGARIGELELGRSRR
jgi:CubicO group peptidase (beta-lactamase class C family)